MFQIQVGLAQHAKKTEVFYSGNGSHHVHDFIALGFELLQVVAVHLHGELAFHAAHRFFHVVGNGLRKFHSTPGIWLSCLSIAAIRSSLSSRKTGRH